MEKRIYGKSIDINTEAVQKFYDKRAGLVEERGWGAISLGDEDHAIAGKVFQYDRDSLFPRLNVALSTRVLELGCGMGRWAKIVLPYCGHYCGVDFSGEMLKAAEKICADYQERCHFYKMSAPDAAEKPADFYGGSFECVILSGVCIYINDLDLHRIFRALPNLCSQYCTICIKETAAFQERLTLDHFESASLHSAYDAIYRTPDEYNMFFQPSLDAGFSVVEQGFLPEETGRRRKETDSFCTIFRK